LCNIRGTEAATRQAVSDSLPSCVIARSHTVSEMVKTVMADFHDIACFPSVLGCIDGTQIPVLSPRLNENIYVCRKGYHAISVQVICDANLRMLNIVAKWPGTTHDSFIFKTSSVFDYLEK
jgi:hypothetical protein